MLPPPDRTPGGDVLDEIQQTGLRRLEPPAEVVRQSWRFQVPVDAKHTVTPSGQCGGDIGEREGAAYPALVGVETDHDALGHDSHPRLHGRGLPRLLLSRSHHGPVLLPWRRLKQELAQLPRDLLHRAIEQHKIWGLAELRHGHCPVA